MPKYRVEWTEGTRYRADVAANNMHDAEEAALSADNKQLVGRFITVTDIEHTGPERRTVNGTEVQEG